MIEVITSGFHTTFQDKGRFGFREYGIPVSGSMDQISALMANKIVGNADNKVVLEYVLNGPILKFNCMATIAITGGTSTPMLDNVRIEMNKPISIKKGQVLKVGNCINGNYGYIAISGGFTCPKKFGSASYYDSILPGNKINKGDNLRFASDNSSLIPHPIKIKPNSIFAVKGPEFGLLSELQQKQILDEQFILTQEISRMGFRLSSTSETYFAPEIISSPVQPGTIQLTPSGQLIVLMRDAQTTGGYARIMQLDDQSVSLLAQKRPSDIVSFVIKPNKLS